MDGDTVFIKEQHYFEDGEIMAICIADSVVLKRCYHFEGGLRMKSENTENKYGDQIYSKKQLEDKTAVALYLHPKAGETQAHAE